jgi:hypothetical protein
MASDFVPLDPESINFRRGLADLELFRDLIAKDKVGQFARPALIDGARSRPQHDCEYKQATGNGGSILSIFAHDEPPILKHPRTRRSDHTDCF